MFATTCQSMRHIEEHAFALGHSADHLMEAAGLGMAKAIMDRYPKQGNAVAYIGKGNNGGDALVVLRHLYDAGWRIALHGASPPSSYSGLPADKLHLLDGLSPDDQPADILIDGLLGIGAEGPLRPPLDQLAEEMNTRRIRERADTIAMDIPSGVNGDTGEVTKGAVIADLTLTVAVPKVGLLHSQAVNHVGPIHCIPLKELPPPGTGEVGLLSPTTLPNKRRDFNFHKGRAGRVGIWAGSKGMLGAAALCAEGALRGGAGLITLYCTEELYPLMVNRITPEVMVKPLFNIRAMLAEKHDAIAIGPGLGLVEVEKLWQIIDQIECPLVLDADALNFIAEHSQLENIPANSILTPHTGEMRRLMPEAREMSREEIMGHFAEKYPFTLLYKGARTLIKHENSALWVNGTGSPGMATPGMGDVLTGVIAALCAQGHTNLEAAKLGAYLCGKAAEIAIDSGQQSQHSLTAGDVLKNLGRATR